MISWLRPIEVSLDFEERSYERGETIDDVYVDMKRLVYAIDRFARGLYILEMEI